jgi:hypothetical protein
VKPAGIACLALVGSLTLGSVGRSDPSIPRERVLRRPELRLSQTQKDALARLEDASRAEARQIENEIRKQRRLLEAHYREYVLNSQEIANLHRRINDAQSRLLEGRLRMQKELRAILSVEQFHTLQAILREAHDDDGRRRDPSHDR